MPIASILTPELREMLQTNDAEGLRAFCEAMHPASTADFLEELSVDETWSVLSHCEPPREAAIFQYLPATRQREMIIGGGRSRMARLIEAMAADDRVDLLQDLDDERREEFLPLVAQAEREDIKRLLQYPENSVGSVMTTDYATLAEDLLVSEALQRLRLQAPDRETIYYIYTLDSERRLVGMVTLRQLILARPTARLAAIMERQVITAFVDEDKEQAAQKLARYDLIALPVVDRENRMVGIITYDDVIDVVVEAATEDVHRMGAVAPLVENYLEASFFTVWRKRAFWLTALFVGEMLTFTAMSRFEDAIAAVVILSMFIPLCLSIGGNSGSQAATLTTRALALGQVNVLDWGRVLRHELFMGAALGLWLGVLGFARGAATSTDLRGNRATRPESFVIRVPRELAVVQHGDGSMELPAGSVELLQGRLQRRTRVTLPPGQHPQVTTNSGDAFETYRFPPQCVVTQDAVSRWRLAGVLALSVTAICTWGTLIGSMLPLAFKHLGIDPGIASSPFVATFVDVTGIVIYFSIAKMYLL